MAAVETLDIAEPQVLIHYPNDRGGFFYHHRILLYRIRDALWIWLTPDPDMCRHDLMELTHIVLDRRSPFPANVAAQVYAHPFEHN